MRHDGLERITEEPASCSCMAGSKCGRRSRQAAHGSRSDHADDVAPPVPRWSCCGSRAAAVTHAGGGVQRSRDDDDSTSGAVVLLHPDRNALARCTTITFSERCRSRMSSTARACVPAIGGNLLILPLPANHRLFCGAALTEAAVAEPLPPPPRCCRQQPRRQCETETEGLLR